MHRCLRGLLVVLVPLLAAASLVAVPGGARAADPTDPPVVGQCRALTYREMKGATDPSAVVPCSTTHTAYTFAVPTFPNGTDLATTATATLEADAVAACTKAARPYFRGSYVRKDMALWWTADFIPSTAQLGAGEDWIECDIDAVWPDKAQLQPLPPIRKPLYAATEPRAVTLCYTAGLIPVPCTARHRWRDVGGFTLSRGGYPARRQFVAAGQRRCPAITKSRRYLVTWPKRPRWKQGDHAVLCARSTTS